MRVRAADRVAPEHPGRVQVARVRELARDLRDGVGATRGRLGVAPRAACASAVLIARPPGAPRRGSSGTRCSGRGSPRAPRGSRRPRVGHAAEEIGRSDDEARRAEAALHRARLGERLLHRDGARRPSPSPSTVTTSCPSACAASTRHEQTSSPSRSTEHEPHSPCSQAFFEPGSSSRSRSVVSRLSPAQTSASRRSPLTVSSILTRGTSRAHAA